MVVNIHPPAAMLVCVQKCRRVDVILIQGVKVCKAQCVIDLTQRVDFHGVCVCYMQADCPLLYWC